MSSDTVLLEPTKVESSQGNEDDAGAVRQLTSPALFPITSKINDVQVSEHFKLYEFADHNDAELVVLNPMLPLRLERVRATLSTTFRTDIILVVNSGTRTPRSNALLAETLGWIDEGGSVSRTSTHQPEYGGIAADIQALFASSRAAVNHGNLIAAARSAFDYVQPAPTRWLHCDLRIKCKI